MSATKRWQDQPLQSNSKDFYPISQFQKLAQTNSKTSIRKGSGNRTTVEEIYATIIKELTSPKMPRLNHLAKKASGILKLTKYQSVETHSNNFEFDYNELVYNHALETDHVKYLKPPEVKKFSTHLEEHQAEIISRLANNGGDFSEIWDEFEAGSSSTSSRQSFVSKSSFGSRSTSSNEKKERPSWKYFANHNKLSSATSNSSIASSLMSTRSNLSGRGQETYKNYSQPRSKTTRVAKEEVQQNKNGEYMKHVFVIKGQAVTFKGDEFKSFRNWFGNDDLLKKCRPRHREVFRRELEMSSFSPSDIRMRLYENYKLVIEAYKPAPPLRFKTTILLPKGVPVDNLIMCRTAAGRLVILNAQLPLSDSKVHKRQTLIN